MKEDELKSLIKWKDYAFRVSICAGLIVGIIAIIEEDIIMAIFACTFLLLSELKNMSGNFLELNQMRNRK